MNNIEDLILQHCTKGLPWVRLDSVCTLAKGSTPIQKAEPGEYPMVVTAAARKTCSTYQFSEPSVCIPLVSSRGHGVAAINQVYYQEGKFALGNILCAVTPKDSSQLNAKFLCYFINYTKDKTIVPLMTGGANVSLTVKTLSTAKVQVPPLPVQEEIVRILDTMSGLVDNLDEEIKARQKQYEHYREELLTFGDEVDLVKLIDVADVLYGCPFDAKQFTEDDAYIPVIRIRDIVPGVPSTYLKGDYDDKYIIHRGDILVGMDGNFNLAKWNSRDAVLCQRSCKIEANSNNRVDNGYLYHLLGPIFKTIEDNTPGGSVKHLSAKAINAIVFPLPPRSVQHEIVEKLDAFEDLIQNLTAERDLRQKQYEYYREKLLTF